MKRALEAGADHQGECDCRRAKLCHYTPTQYRDRSVLDPLWAPILDHIGQSTGVNLVLVPEDKQKAAKTCIRVAIHEMPDRCISANNSVHPIEAAQSLQIRAPVILKCLFSTYFDLLKVLRDGELHEEQDCFENTRNDSRHFIPGTLWEVERPEVWLFVRASLESEPNFSGLTSDWRVWCV